MGQLEVRGNRTCRDAVLRNSRVILIQPLHMNSLATLSFSIQPFEGARSVTPYVNGESLIKLASAFEHEQGFSPAGGYGPLVPAWFSYGPLDRYFLGDFEPDSYFVNLQGVYLLGCDCGEVGCWPLLAHIETSGETVKWSRFRQPFRKEWIYTDFGPFVFNVEEYKETVAALRDEFLVLARDCRQS
jgi:hypothetical protein